jgi:periplasmic copper chaperone A
VKSILLAVTLAALATVASADNYQLGAIKIDHPWSRATPKGATTAAGYVTITNTGNTLDRLLGGTMGNAERAQVHQITTDHGVMTMRPVTGGLEIKPGEMLELKPDSFHLMFAGLKEPLVNGQSVKGSLTFEKAGSVEVEFAVEGVGAPTTSEMKHMHMDR